jgi:hypothetical protein
VHRDDVPHALDLVVLVQDPGIAEPVEEDVRMQVAAHPLVFVLARHRDSGEVLGQLHPPDPGNVPSRGPSPRIVAL